MRGKRRFLFLGDSITDAKRLFSEQNGGLGEGYVSLIARRLAAANPSAQVFNRGHDGFTLPRLIRNLPVDCYPLNPDLVTVLIGINDLSLCHIPGNLRGSADFLDSYGDLLGKLRLHTGAAIFCMTPFLFPWPQEYQSWLPLLEQLNRGIERLACRFQASFLNLQEPLAEAARQTGYGALTTDGVHLTGQGHRLLADWWLAEAAKRRLIPANAAFSL